MIGRVGISVTIDPKMTKVNVKGQQKSDLKIMEGEGELGLDDKME